jgi:CRP-like cAMP-binding protein
MARLARSLCIDPHWRGRAECRHCAVRAAMPFSALELEELDAVLGPIDNFIVPARTTIGDLADTGSHLFTIRRGLVKLEATTAAGQTRIVRLLRSGDVIGLDALAGGAAPHVAWTITEADLCRIPLALMRDLDAQRPRLHAALLQRWQSALRQADAFMLEILHGPAPARMARLLRLLVTLADGAPPAKLSRLEIAAACDIAPETASRVASDWIARGWLRERDHSFEIDAAALDRVLED